MFAFMSRPIFSFQLLVALGETQKRRLLSLKLEGRKQIQSFLAIKLCLFW